MRTLSALLLLSLAAAFAPAQTLKDYLKLRKTYKITQAVGVEALETMVGARTFEIAGTVKGHVRVGETVSLMLQKSDGNTMFVHSPKPVDDWLRGNEIAVRLIVMAERADEGLELKASLLGAAPESSITPIEYRATAAATTTSRKGTRTGRPAKEWNLPASEATPIYASFIKGRNKRLSDSEAYHIAQGIIGFSLKYGVDARLIMAMVMTESGFNPNATSRVGAMGLGQLMPGTARGMGVSNAYDSMQNLYGTVRLIRGHLDKYGRTNDSFGALTLSLAAYNAGGGAVKKHGGTPPYRETQNYVKKVTALYRALCGA